MTVEEEQEKAKKTSPMRKHVLMTFGCIFFLPFFSLIKNSRTASLRLHLPKKRQKVLNRLSTLWLFRLQRALEN